MAFVLCHQWIDGWPGLEGASPKPRGFLRSAQSSPGHPIHHSKSARALATRVVFCLRSSYRRLASNGTSIRFVVPPLGGIYAVAASNFRLKPGLRTNGSFKPSTNRLALCRSKNPLTCFCIAALLILSSVSSAQEPPLVLPFTTTDQIVMRDGTSQRTKVIPGVIEDLAGHSVVFRRGGNAVEVFKLRDIESLQFGKTASFDEGLRQIQDHEWLLAIASLRIAETTEPRAWVVREIQASLAEALRAAGKFDECTEVVERIFDADPNTRHLNLLPLVWDERLPPEHRVKVKPEDLKSPSLLRQFVAASALLQDPAHESTAAAVLQTLKTGPRAALQELAEAQLWRLRLLHPETIRATETALWMQRVRDFDRRQRSGPDFVIGRALLAVHDYDNASTSLLWMPLVAPLDPPTTVACTKEAITALKQSGRVAEAEQLQRDLDDIQPIR